MAKIGEQTARTLPPRESPAWTPEREIGETEMRITHENTWKV
jgi:hypothetical protein